MAKSSDNNKFNCIPLLEKIDNTLNIWLWNYKRFTRIKIEPITFFNVKDDKSVQSN